MSHPAVRADRPRADLAEAGDLPDDLDAVRLDHCVLQLAGEAWTDAERVTGPRVGLAGAVDGEERLVPLRQAEGVEQHLPDCCLAGVDGLGGLFHD